MDVGLLTCKDNTRMHLDFSSRTTMKIIMSEVTKSKQKQHLNSMSLHQQSNLYVYLCFLKPSETSPTKKHPHLEVLLPGGAILLGTTLFISKGSVNDHCHKETKVEIPATFFHRFTPVKVESHNLGVCLGPRRNKQSKQKRTGDMRFHCFFELLIFADFILDIPNSRPVSTAVLKS